MTELNPIFDNIMSSYFPSLKKPPKCIETAKEHFEADIENTPDLFQLSEDLEAIKTAVKDYPEQLVKTISDELIDIYEKLVEADICPVCGEKLEAEADHAHDTRVPYGGTSVTESEGYVMRCQNCGFRKE